MLLVHLYGLFIFFGILAVLLFIKNVTSVAEEKLYSLVIWIYVYSFFFGKLCFFLVDYIFDFDCFNILMISNFLLSGFSVLGASLGGVIALLSLYEEKKLTSKENELAYIPVSLFLLHGFGRIGCYFADCCGGSNFYFLPLQLIATIFYFIIFFSGLILIKKKKIQSIYSALLYYAFTVFLERFFTDYFREDAVFVSNFFTKYQLLAASYLVIVYFLVVFFEKYNRYRRCD